MYWGFLLQLFDSRLQSLNQSSRRNVSWCFNSKTHILSNILAWILVYKFVISFLLLLWSILCQWKKTIFHYLFVLSFLKSIKQLILPKRHFRTYLFFVCFFSIFGWGGPSSGRANWQLSDGPYQTEFVLWHVDHFHFFKIF